MIYLTSDTHFFHKNIYGPEGFEPTRRHFQSVEEMNETIELPERPFGEPIRFEHADELVEEKWKGELL